ncbi:MAG: transcription antitermination factor NusB [bacterium]|nr:transcription antitermination factor NusB [bacterium]
MKTAFDPRHQRRKQAVQDLFTWGFNDDQHGCELAQQVVTKIPEIDKLIIKAAPQWPIDQINRVDLAILRLALYELEIVKTEPLKVIVDEAVELAKEFGSESSSSFVNGVLGNIIKEEKENEQPSTA